jgi:hypothetical protein
MAKFVEKIVNEVVKGVVNEMLKKTGLTGRSRSTSTRSKSTSSGGLLGSIIDAALGKGTAKSKPKTASAAKKKPTTKAKAAAKPASKTRTSTATAKKTTTSRKAKS